jgi:serine/threonine protein kinase
MVDSLNNRKCAVFLNECSFHQSKFTDPNRGMIIELLTQMLQINPKKRISAAQALEHPLFAKWANKEEKMEFQPRSRLVSTVSSLPMNLSQVCMFHEKLPSFM